MSGKQKKNSYRIEIVYEQNPENKKGDHELGGLSRQVEFHGISIQGLRGSRFDKFEIVGNRALFKLQHSVHGKNHIVGGQLRPVMKRDTFFQIKGVFQAIVGYFP